MKIKFLSPLLLLLVTSLFGQSPQHIPTLTRPIMPGLDLMFCPFNLADDTGDENRLYTISTMPGMVTDSVLEDIGPCLGGTYPAFCGVMFAIEDNAYFRFNNPSGFPYVIIDEDGMKIDSFHAVKNGDSHDIQFLDGLAYISTKQDSGPVLYTGFEVQDSASKTLLYEWTPFDYDTSCSIMTLGNDYLHGNSIEPFHWGAETWVLISNRHQGLALVSPSGSYQMIGGNCSDYFVFGDMYAQHDARILAVEGDKLIISAFNNGNDREYSSGSIYILDSTLKTFNVINEIVHPDSVFSPRSGSFRLIEGGYVIGWGFSLDTYISASVFDRNGALLSDITFPDMETGCYRVIPRNMSGPLPLGFAPLKEVPALPQSFKYFNLLGQEVDPAKERIFFKVPSYD